MSSKEIIHLYLERDGEHEQADARRDKLISIITANEDKIFCYLTINDVLNLFLSAKSSAGIVLSSSTINLLMKSFQKGVMTGLSRLTVNSPMSLGVFQKTLYRLAFPMETFLTVTANGRVLLDMGSAYDDLSETIVASACPVMDNQEDNLFFDFNIEKSLEKASYDEFDDFTPTHPQPRVGGHRRGNSLFNSDVEMYANQALSNFDLDLRDIIVDMQRVHIP